MIKLIVFDLWNTLIPATIDWPHLRSLVGKKNMDLGDFISRYEFATQLKNYKSFSAYKKDFIKEFGPDSDLLEKEFYEIYTNRMDKINFFSDVEKNLVKLKEKGFKLALLSNTESIAFRKVDSKLNISKYFDFLGLSYKLGAIKPDKKIFLHVLKKFKVNPSDALMVGDSLRSDVTGASGVGMHNVWINRKGKSFDFANIKPEFELNTLNDIHKVVGVLNAREKRIN